MGVNEIEVGAHADAYQPRAFEIEIVLDPDFGIEHPQNARDEQDDDEPRADASVVGAAGVSGEASR